MSSDKLQYTVNTLTTTQVKLNRDELDSLLADVIKSKYNISDDFAIDVTYDTSVFVRGVTVSFSKSETSHIGE